MVSIAAPSSPPSSRNLSLDVLRATAIVLVLGRHLNYFPLWTQIGWAGVDLFFVLSGYLISGLLFEEWQRNGRINFKRFYLRRGFKIYPGFYVLLLVTILAGRAVPAISSHPITTRSILAEAFFLQNYFPSIWGQTWSLAVEEHFYIMLPLLLWLLYRRRDTSDPFQGLPRIFMLVATVEMALRIATTWHFPAADKSATYLTHLRLDGLLFGVLLRYYRQFRLEAFRQLARGAGSLAVMAAALVLLLFVPIDSPVMRTMGFTLIYFGFGLLLVRVVDLQPRRAALFVLKPLARIGQWSYSIYLWHGFVCRLLPHNTLFMFWVGMTLSILLGGAMAKLIEYPALALRDRVLPKPEMLQAQCAIP